MDRSFGCWQRRVSWKQLWGVKTAWSHLPMQKEGVASKPVGHREGGPSRESWLLMGPGAERQRRCGGVAITITINLTPRTMVAKGP